jgi:hypothetical protein
VSFPEAELPWANTDEPGGSGISRRKRSASRKTKRAERWLGSGPAARERPWAYEEILFASNGDGEQSAELSSLAADLAVDLADLRRLQNELYDQVVRIAGLEGRIQALQSQAPVDAGEGAEEVRAAIDVRSLPTDPTLPRAAQARPSPARSEGFEVDSPQGPVGYVEGLRFVSRIDEPDLLEVRGGRFGRELVLIPVEAVEEVLLEEERIVVRSVPRGLQDDQPTSELVRVFRKALHHEA